MNGSFQKELLGSFLPRVINPIDVGQQRSEPYKKNEANFNDVQQTIVLVYT